MGDILCKSIGHRFECVNSNATTASTSKTPSPVPAPDLGSDNGCRDAPNEITPVQDEITPVQENTTLVQENIAPALGLHASASNDRDAVSVNEPLGRLRPRLELGNSSPYFINSPYPGWTPPWGDYTPYQGSMNVPIPISKVLVFKYIHRLIVS